jgi:hypothetical protein
MSSARRTDKAFASIDHAPMNWSAFDFVFSGGLMAIVLIAFFLVTRRAASRAYKVAAAVALGAGFVLVWGNAAVGVIGSEDNPANLMYWGVLAAGVVGAMLARLRPHGMARTLIAMAVLQAIVPIVAAAMGWAPSSAGWAMEATLLTAIFAALWLFSARLFWKAGDAESRGAN